MHDEQSELVSLLYQANESVRAEILRQSEAYLEAQLTAGIAADQRATTFAGMLAAALAVLGGGTAAIAAGLEKEISSVLIVPALPAIVGFFWSIKLATYAGRPIEWNYVGNSPWQWRKDLAQKKQLSLSLAEQVTHYAVGIEDNKKALDKQAETMNLAIKVAWYGLFGSAILSVLVLCWVKIIHLNIC